MSSDHTVTMKMVL